MNLQKTKLDIQDGIGQITMDCPENLNAIDVQMAREILFLLEQCNENPEVKVVVLKGSARAFSAGGDIGFLYRNIQNNVPHTDELVVLVGKLTLYMKRMKKLVITSVSGPAAGAGANLALSGDFVLAAAHSKFIQAFVGIALVPDTGGPYLLSRSIGAQRALEMCLTGRPVPAEEAYRLGLLYEVCPKEELDAHVEALAHKLAAGPLLSYCKIKEQVYGAAFRDYDHYLHHVEEETMNLCATTEDYREGICAFVEKRKPNFNGR